MSRLLSTIGSIILYTSICVNAQTIAEDDLKDLGEQVVVELSNSFFIPGENLHISIRITDDQGSNSPISKVAYVELINSDQLAVLREKVAIKDGLGHGEIYLPSYLKTGGYTLITYTRWMKNYSRTRVFQRGIEIINPYELVPKKIFNDHATLDVKLFPKGGLYQAGTIQQVMYQITDQFGRHIPVTCRLVDSEGETVSTFNTAQSPQGTFSFIPQRGISYRLLMIDENQTVHFRELPTIQEPREIRFTCKESVEAFEIMPVVDSAQPCSNCAVSVWWKGTQVFQSNIETRRIISKTDLPKGSLTIIIKNFQKEILYEHNIFNTPGKIPVSIALSKTQIQARDAVEVTLKSEEMVPAHHLTLSIRKKQPFTNTSNQVASYFLGNLSMNKAIVWPAEEVIAPLFNPQNSNETKIDSIRFWPDLRGELVKGIITNARLEAIANRRLTLTAPSKPNQTYFGETNEHGQFHFNIQPSHFNSDYIIYLEDDVRQMNFSIEDPFLSNHEFVHASPLFFDSVNVPWLEKKSIRIQVENAYYQQKKQNLTDSLAKNAFIHVEPTSYVLEEFTRFPTMADPLKEYVSEVWLNTNTKNPRFSMPSITNSSGSVDSVFTLLNGIPISYSKVLSLDPLLVEKIEVFNKQMKIGNSEFNGVVNFQTYDRDVDRFNLGKSYKKIDYDAAPFGVLPTQPGYVDQSLKRIPDFRYQLLWEPHLTMDQGVYKTRFHASDISGTYEIILSGVVGFDQYVYESTTFEVIE